MNHTVCIFASTMGYPQGGGHFWVYLNWALGLRANGCQVIWLEGVNSKQTPQQIQSLKAILQRRLKHYGLEGTLALFNHSGQALPQEVVQDCKTLEEATKADLLLNQCYNASADIVRRFRRSALLDIDPGLLQMWISRGVINLPVHDLYFTIGETIGHQDTQIPDIGLTWNYTPPCVALDWWPVHPAPENARFTTVSHWSMDEWEEEDGELYENNKRRGFLPFLDLPQHVSQPLELALCLGDNEEGERESLIDKGWHIRHSHDLTATPWDYQRYIQESLGEFSCVKPSCIRLQNAWISDRTICYLASGKPAIVQHTGPSRFLPDAEGLFRFRDLQEAVQCLETVAADYEHQCSLARALAEEYFDAKKVAGSVLERALN